MNRNRLGRTLPAVLAGTVLIGTLAFATQVEAQQSGAEQQRPQRSAEQRGAGGPGRRGGPGGDSLMVERRLGMLTERLTLTGSQRATVRAILADEHARIEALLPEGARGFGGRGGPRGARTDAAGTRERTRPDSAQMAQRRTEMEQVRAQVTAIRTETDARIEQVLTADQRAVYRELVAKRPEGGPGRSVRGGRGGAGRGGFDRGAGRGTQAPPPGDA